MSSKQKVAGASTSKAQHKGEQDAPTTLVPKLRFPGFKKPWANEPLAKSLVEHKLKNTARRDVFSVSMESGIVNQIEHLGRSFAASDTAHYNLGRRYDVVYTKSPLKAFPFGIVKQCKFDGEVALSPLYGVFTPDNPHLGLMIEAYFESPNRSIAFLTPLCQKGAKNTIQITNTTFLSGKLPLPTEPAEQQKIAECLSSVDELMAAQARKVDALKTHKKGLMQQLFPGDGETQPHLRLPKFVNAGKWRVRRLDNIGRVIRGASPRPKGDPRYYGGPVPRLMVQDVTRDGKWVTPKIDSLTNEGARLSRPCPAGTLTIVCSGTVGVVSFLAVDACIHDGFLALVDIDESIATKDFLYHSLSTLRLQFEEGATHGGVFTNLTTSGIEQFEIKCPEPTEQKRIAECLSSLDDLITAETQKLEALKSHKKGLMQQLFPTLED